MVIGQRKYDWEVLEETCEYDGGYNKEHPTIKNVMWPQILNKIKNELTFSSG